MYLEVPRAKTRLARHNEGQRAIDAQNPRSGEWLQNDRAHKAAVISSDHRSFLAGWLNRDESYQSVMHGRGIGLLSSKFSEE